MEDQEVNFDTLTDELIHGTHITSSQLIVLTNSGSHPAVFELISKYKILEEKNIDLTARLATIEAEAQANMIVYQVIGDDLELHDIPVIVVRPEHRERFQVTVRAAKDTLKYDPLEFAEKKALASKQKQLRIARYRKFSLPIDHLSKKQRTLQRRYQHREPFMQGLRGLAVTPGDQLMKEAPIPSIQNENSNSIQQSLNIDSDERLPEEQLRQISQGANPGSLNRPQKQLSDSHGIIFKNGSQIAVKLPVTYASDQGSLPDAERPSLEKPPGQEHIAKRRRGKTSGNRKRHGKKGRIWTKGTNLERQIMREEGAYMITRSRQRHVDKQTMTGDTLGLNFSNLKI